MGDVMIACALMWRISIGQHQDHARERLAEAWWSDEDGEGGE